MLVALLSLPRRQYIYIFLLALAFRLFLLLAFHWDNHITDSYDTIAINLIQGRGFSYNGLGPTVCRAPVYPLCLAILFLGFGYHPEPFLLLRLVNIFCDSLTATLVLHLSCKWFSKVNRSMAFAGGAVYALNLFAAYYTVKLGEETISIFVFVLYLLLLHMVLFRRKDRLRNTVTLGVLGGIMILNKSVFLPVVIAIPFSLFLIFPGFRNRNFALTALVATVISLAVISPWMVRNMIVAKRLVLVQTLTGYNFWYDFSLDRNRDLAFESGKLDRPFSGDPVQVDSRVYAPYSLNAREDARYDSKLVREAAIWAARNPASFLSKVCDNLLSFWYLTETPLKMIIAGLFSLLLILTSVWGVNELVSLGQGREALLFLFVVGLIDLIYSPVIGVFRYSLVTYPLLAPLSGCSLGRFAHGFAARHQTSS